MFEFLKNKKQLTNEQKFWKYFSRNKKSLEEFINSDLSDYTVYNNLTDEIHKYSDLIFPEITQNIEGKFVLIITPDGKPSGIPDTEKLYDSKPEIENWIIEKFRQPKEDLKFKYDGLEYPSSDIQIIPELDKEEDKINIRVYIKNMDLDKDKYQTMAWLYLDNILGEYNSITKLGYVDFFHLDDRKTVRNSISILELRKLIDKEIYKVE
ncbi:MAG TPA: hypothetical protein VGA80_08740 [Flavobacteriaceae bacterium]